MVQGPLKSGVTNMQYVGKTCPDDGSYTLTNTTPGCFNFTWQGFSLDHTGDAGGRFMLVNASFEPSDFYVDTVSGLCGNTIYEFAGWVANVLKPFACAGAGIRPSLTFRIETTAGAILKEFNSGDILPESFLNWKQYGTFFSTPAGTGAVVLRIRNNAPGGCGNDLALDDITFRPCGPKITAYIHADDSTATEACKDLQADINLTTSFSTGFIDPVLQWQLSKDSGKTWIDIAGAQATNYLRKPTTGGLFLYRATISERTNFVTTTCRVASNLVTIDVHAVPTGPTLTNVLGCTGAPVSLGSFSDNSFTYHWTGPNGVSAVTPVLRIAAVAFKDAGPYRLDLHNSFGCGRIDTFQLNVSPNASVTVSAPPGICEGSSAMITATGGVLYEWSPTAGLSDAHIANPIASPPDTTVYKIIVTNQYGCRDSALVTLNVWKNPRVNAGQDLQIFEGESATLSGSITGSYLSFAWAPLTDILNSNTLTPLVSPADRITYTLSAITNFGCGTVSDDIVIGVYKKIKVPNIFSPNGDGINDTWIIPHLETYPHATVKVFNRNGHILFQSVNNDKSWDGLYNGKPAPVGTYYYLIDLGLHQPPFSGWIVVIR
ncbi:MAG: hypothetical protein JWQ78_1992 [Sediminibacterium sp.]|nr:hypothetical protein [Sediminibacterium sp.]